MSSCATTRPRWFRTAVWTLAVLVALPVLYVLSFGPAWRIATRGPFEARDAFLIVYGPILRLAKRSHEHTKLRQYPIAVGP